MNMRDDLKAYLDGELDPARMSEIETALKHSPELQREADELRALSVAISQAAQQLEPMGLENTLKALQGRPKPVRLNWGRVVCIGGLAGACVLAISVIRPMMSSSDSADSSASADTMAANSFQADAKSQPEVMAKSAAPAAPQQRVALNSKAPATTPPINQSPSPTIGSVSSEPTPPPTAGKRTRETNMESLKSRVASNDSKRPLLLSLAPTSVTGGNSSTGAVTLSAFAAKPNSQVILLGFESAESGQKQVMALVGKYEVADYAPANVSTQEKSGKEKTIVIDVPEDMAEQTIQSLKKLTEPPPSVAQNSFAGAAFGAANNGGIGGGAGGNAGRNAGGFAGGFGGGGGAAPNNSANTKKSKVNDSFSTLSAKDSNGTNVKLGSNPAADKVKPETAFTSRSKFAETRRLSDANSKPVNRSTSQMAGGKMASRPGVIAPQMAKDQEQPRRLDPIRQTRMRRITIVLTEKPKSKSVP